MSDIIYLTKAENEILSSFKELEIDNEYFGINDYEDDIGEAVASVINQLQGKNWAYGATKFVIIPENVKFVIKIPFAGEWRLNDDDEYIFDYYEREDYCGIEADMYEEIADDDISMMFAATAFYASSKSGVPLYIQEKIKETCDECNPANHRSSKDSYEKAKEMTRYSSFPADWIGVAIDYYGEEVVEHFLEYAECQLNDMHSGNFGYRFDGSPVVVDFSGYLS